MNKNIKNILSISFLCSFVLSVTACGPREVTVEDYIKVAKSSTGGEEVELLREESSNCYSFKSTQRDLTFKVWTTPDEVVYNGNNLGYSGSVSFYDDYSEVIHNYYEEDLTNILADNSFEIISRSDEYDYTETLYIVMDSELTDDDKALFDSLMLGLQEINDNEQKYHNPKLAVAIYCVQVWIYDNGQYYITSYYNPSEKAMQTDVFIEGGAKALTYNSFKRTDVQGVDEIAINDANTILISFVEE